MNIIKNIAQDYNINPKDLKHFVKEEGLKPKKTTRLQVLEIIYINAPDLFYCRADEFTGMVEYLNYSLVIKLMSEYSYLKEVYNG